MTTITHYSTADSNSAYNLHHNLHYYLSTLWIEGSEPVTKVLPMSESDKVPLFLVIAKLQCQQRRRSGEKLNYLQFSYSDRSYFLIVHFIC